MLRDAVDLAIAALEKQVEYSSINEELSAKGDNAKTNLEIAKEIIEENIADADCGLFNSHNIVGDPMSTIYHKDGLTIDICYHWAYFEVLGLPEEEFKELEVFYEKLLKKDKMTKSLNVNIPPIVSSKPLKCPFHKKYYMVENDKRVTINFDRYAFIDYIEEEFQECIGNECACYTPVGCGRR